MITVHKYSGGSVASRPADFPRDEKLEASFAESDWLREENGQLEEYQWFGKENGVTYRSKDYLLITWFFY